MSEEEKLEEVVNRLKRLLAKQNYIEDRMKKLEGVVKEREDEG
jgi:conjugal transfer/entry exclusion protein